MAGRTDQGHGFGTLDRLHRPDEFAAVMASRNRRFGGGFELRFRLRAPSDTVTPIERARLGLIIPKRLAKRAVLRNLLKRLAREAFRNANPGLPPMDMVLRLAKPALTAGERPDRLQRQSWRKAIDELIAGVPR